MSKYKVIITETLEKVVEVEAKNKIEAEQIVLKAWDNSEYVLTADNFARVNISAEKTSRVREGIER